MKAIDARFTSGWHDEGTPPDSVRDEVLKLGGNQGLGDPAGSPRFVSVMYPAGGGEPVRNEINANAPGAASRLLDELADAIERVGGGTARQVSITFLNPTFTAVAVRHPAKGPVADRQSRPPAQGLGPDGLAAVGAWARAVNDSIDAPRPWSSCSWAALTLTAGGD
ncbi:MAG: hypothetical protein C0501_09830 [Isosphaera sp.]|nr:hypothetical protein [Isosphaera sp.]